MAQTENGFYYPDDYTKVADVPEDIKKLAESVDVVAGQMKNNIDTNSEGIKQIKKENETQNKMIEQISNNILDISKEQQTQSANIEELQKNQEKLQVEVQELNEDIKANAIIEETEKSKSLYIDDANASRGKVNVFGNMEQEIREGYNLIDILNSTLINTNKSVEIEIDKDGYVIANGTPTADYIVFIRKSIDNLIEDKQTYSLWQEKYSTVDNGGVYSQILVESKEGSSGSQQFIQASTKKVTFVVDKSNYNYTWTLQIGLRSVAGTFNNYKNRYMLYKGTDNKEFELYGATPSLDYPSAIKSLGSNINLYPGWEKNTISSETGKPEIDPNYIRSVDFISVLPNKNYTIKAYNIKEFGDLNTAVRMYDINKNYLSSKWIGSIINKSITFTLTNADVRYVKIVCSNNNTVTNTAKVDIKLEEGEGATTYSPFEQGSTEIKHTNKNIVDLLAQTLKINGWHMSESYNENDTKVLKLPYNQNAIWDTFYFSLDERYVGKNISFSFDIKVKNLKYLNPERFCLQNSNEYSKSVIKNMYSSSLKEDTYTRITVEGYNLKNSTIAFFAGIKYNSEEPNTDSMYVYIKNFQIELGEQVTDYTEHQEESCPLDIQQDMVSSEDDYFDLEREKEVHGWKKVAFDGVENKFTGSFTVGENRVFRVNGNYWDSSSSIETTDVKCTHFKTSNSWAEGTIYGKYTTSGVALQVILKNSVASSKEILNDILKQKYDAGEPMIVYYKDEAPTELDLTDTQIEQLEKLNKLRFYEGVNNIMTLEDIALIQAEYSVNLKDVNNKMRQEIDEIKELLSTTQTSAMLLDNLEQDLIKEVE